ncbi:MAG: helix-turn-helix domain-containing protein [Cyclobacteriaceae bacterium]
MSGEKSVSKTFELAESFVNYTSRNVFLTGKAGTGKTTFLRHIVDNTSKKTVVAAPTGVAAINAGGVTMHSLFQLPFGPYIPDYGSGLEGQVNTRSNLISKIRFNQAKRKLLKEMELLIIDEISMVRADMLDATDAILRYIRKKPDQPFGGLQVLMIGDMFQLPPVTSDNDWSIIGKYYQTPYFFSAKALEEGLPICIELKKIYRQSNREFVDLLNQVRMNQVSPDKLEWLNRRYQQDFEPEINDQFITLTTHNKKAVSINQTQLRKLTTKSFQFKATIEGEFQESAYPVAERLELKEGAQVIFTKNDKEEPRRYYNGKIGVVSDIGKDRIKVTFPEEETEISVEEEEWKNIRYSLDEEKNELQEKELGSFRQYPLKLAWAITIHKSQGLTFQKAVVDAGSSFSPGQVYVALSRLTTIEGLILKSKVTYDSIRTDTAIIRFAESLQDDEVLEPVLEKERQEYIRGMIISTFEWNDLIDSLLQLKDYVLQSKITFKDTATGLINQWEHSLNSQRATASKFSRQLLGIFQTGDMQLLRERMQKATAYFIEEIDEKILELLKEHELAAKSKKNVKSYLKNLLLFQLKVSRKKSQLEQAMLLSSGLAGGARSLELLQAVDQHKQEPRENLAAEVEKHKPEKKAKGESQRMSLEMFKEGKSIFDIAGAREMAYGTIESHLAGFILTGEVEVSELVDQQKIKDIETIIAQLKTESLTEVKKAMSEDYTYGEIRAVFNHLKKEAS